MVWNMYIAGTQVTYGAQVIYAGVTFDTFNLSPYAVTVDTYAPFFLPSPVDVTLVATSTNDPFEAAARNAVDTVGLTGKSTEPMAIC